MISENAGQVTQAWRTGSFVLFGLKVGLLINFVQLYSPAFFWILESRLAYLLISLVLFQGTLNILEEENHIKDALSRIVVEMIKREWPQHWPDMLIELDILSKQGVWNTAISVWYTFPWNKLQGCLILFVGFFWQQKIAFGYT